MTAEPPAGANAALDRFLADNPELEALSARLDKFNVFRALRIEDAEIRHSNTLAWLLDTNGSHGLGDIVLRRVLSNILLEGEAEIEGVSAAQVELMDFTDVEVRREWRCIDVLVIDHRNKLVQVIENKIHASEGHKQLARYLDLVKREFPSFTLVPVFLTLAGQGSEDEESGAWLSYSHSQLLAVVERILGQRRAQLTEAVAQFLAHYADTLRRLTMQDEALVNLCRTIYRRHREAIDLIVEHGMASRFQEVVRETLEARGQYEILHAGPRFVYFLPKSWSRVVPENGTTSWRPMFRPVSITCWFAEEQSKIRLVFEATRMDDPKLRVACMEALAQAGFHVTKKALREEATWSRFFTAAHKVEGPNDEDELREAIEKLLAKAEEQFPKAEAVFEHVFGDREK